MTPAHTVARTVVNDDASWTLDCRCGVRFSGKDHGAVHGAWAKHAQGDVVKQDAAAALVKEADSIKGWDRRHAESEKS